MAGKGRPFKKGKRKTGGRAAGVPNKVTKAYKDFLQEVLDDPQVRASMLQRAREGELDVLAIGDRVIGRPAVQIEVAGVEALADSYREALKAAQAAVNEK